MPKQDVMMAKERTETPVAAAEGALAVMILLLAGSGCAALIYEIVWFQLLQIVIGASAVSLGLLLAAYMGGMCLSSAFFARVVAARHHPLRVYALLELGIGVFGLLELFGVPWVGRLYVAGASEGMIGLTLRGMVAGICLLPPTMLMGASLPAISRWAQGSTELASRLGYLYSANIAGSVFGCLLAGFYLLRTFDMAVATYVAVVLNFLVAAAAFLLAARTGYAAKADAKKVSLGVLPPWILLATALSGLTALGAEVVWTRLLSLLLGATVYTFSIILAVFLAGLWAGSGIGSFFVRRITRPGSALAACQVLLALSISWTAYTMSHSLPFWPVDPWLSLDPWFNFELDLARCAWAILPATLWWGASFPLAIAAVARPGEDAGRLSGIVYAANTGGSIIGALAFSLYLIPSIGTRGSQELLIGLAMAAGLLALIAEGFGRPLRLAVAGAAAVVLGFGLIHTVDEVPWQMVAYGRRIAPIMRAFDLYDRSNPTTVLYRGEGINSSIVIAERAGQRHFYVSGKAEASTAVLDMRLERMMGHLPALIHPAPKSVLTVGFGAGVTAGSFVPYPEVETLVICELERQIPPASTEYFGKQNNRVLYDHRTRMVYDDARHYIYTTPEKFDVITTDPIHPWVKGTSVLYSKEYYELCKRRLNPGGVVAQWLPIYDSDPETIRTELATFFSVFPYGTIWSNNFRGDGYDLVLIGQGEPTHVDLDQLQLRLDRPGYANVAESLGEVGFHSAVDFLATYAGRAQDLAPMLKDAPINSDMNMRLQYIAGMGLNSMAFQKIYQDILNQRVFPEGLITGTGPRMDALRTLIAAKPPTPER
jgi:spermidine synthase